MLCDSGGGGGVVMDNLFMSFNPFMGVQLDLDPRYFSSLPLPSFLIYFRIAVMRFGTTDDADCRTQNMVPVDWDVGANATLNL